MMWLAVIVALILQLTGGWAHVSPSGRQRVAHVAARATARPSQLPVVALPVYRPTQTPELFVPPLATASYLAQDRATALPLAQANADTPRPIASITKLITAIVILSRHSEDESVTIGTLPDYPSDADTMGLRTGETYRLGDLVRAALVPSANDAADALALFDAGSTAAFAQRMNDKMTQWGIAETHFSNPSGLDDNGNQASARALAKIGGLALVQPLIREAVGLSDITVVSGSGRSFTLHTTNQLLAASGFRGIKTGYTGAAGECFIGLTNIQAHDVITVVLGSRDRFADTRALVNYIGRNYTWLNS